MSKAKIVDLTSIKSLSTEQIEWLKSNFNIESEFLLVDETEREIRFLINSLENKILDSKTLLKDLKDLKFKSINTDFGRVMSTYPHPIVDTVLIAKWKRTYSDTVVFRY